MRCYKCKALISDGIKYCPKCGAEQGFSEELIKKAIEGDQNATTELYNRTYNAAYQTVKMMIKDEDTVLDIVQDSYMKAFKHLDRLQEPDKFRAWIKRICHNQAVDYLRKTKPVMFSQLSTEDNEVIEFEDDRPENLPDIVIDNRETTRLLKEILNILPDDQRVAVSMFYYEQLSVKEIAETLGCSENTVKSRLNYARKKIEEKVTKLEKEQGIRLHSLAPIPFLALLFSSLEAQAAELPSKAVPGAVQAGSGASTTPKPVGAGTKTMAGKGAKKAGKAGIKATLTKGIAGVTAAAVIGGAGTVLYNNNRTSAPEIEEHYITDFSEIDDATLDEILGLVESEYDELLDSGHTIDIKDGEHDFTFWQEDIQTISDTDLADSGYFAYKTDPSGNEENILFVPCYVSVTNATYVDEFGMQQISFKKAIGAYRIRNIYMQEDGSITYDGYVDFTGFFSTEELLEQAYIDTIGYAYKVSEENLK